MPCNNIATDNYKNDKQFKKYTMPEIRIYQLKLPLREQWDK